MAQGISDVVVHLGRPLGSEERQWIEQALVATPISVLGVLRCFHALGLEALLVAM